jgi:tetratricopeptide (TPR) repeat protein
MRRFAILQLLAALSACALACAPKGVAVVPPPQEPALSERLAAAESLLRAGCLECLTDAVAQFATLSENPAVADAAAAGQVRAAALIALRQRTLGMVDDRYLERAREAAGRNPAARAAYATFLDIVDSARPNIRGLSDADVARRSLGMATSVPQWLEWLRTHADDDAAMSAVWIWFACGNAPTRADRQREAVLASVHQFLDTGVVQYQVDECWSRGDFESLASNDPRFHEIEYWIGMAGFAPLAPGAAVIIDNARLDNSQDHLETAYRWHAAWPSLMTTLAGLYMSAEEFAAALDIYEKATALLPGYGEAAVGRVRALSYLGRHDDAIAAATALLDTSVFRGEAFYWRAWNELRLRRVDDAWADIDQAGRLWVNADVAKLAGIIAYQRHELEVAKAKFEEVRRIDPNDCESLFNLAAVNVEMPAWQVAADGYVVAARCLERSREAAAQQILSIEAAAGREDRKNRQIARLQGQIATANRMLVQSWFNGAVANLNLSRFTEARRLAEQVANDVQFGERAKELLQRLPQ